jgi:hypothetical protein
VTVRIRKAVATFTVLTVATVLATVVIAHRLGSRLSLRLPNLHACVVDTGGAEIALDADQMANAATVSAVGLSRDVPEHAIMVALATGLFQQRPSQGWGTPEEIADPRYSARSFYRALLQVRNWETMRVTEAAQAVQHSAHPEAYEKWADKAEAVARALVGDAAGAVACTVAAEPAERGPAAATALAAGVRRDWGDTTALITAGELPGLTLAVSEPRAGWQYAHWLVAHAEADGVKRVRFTNREWTAKGGSWSKVAPHPADGNRVLAEVYGDG